MTANSVAEQASAGLLALSDDEYYRFLSLNTDYRERFGFPFIIAVRRHDKASLFAAFETRLAHARASEIVLCHRFRDPEGDAGRDVAIRRYLRTRDMGTWVTRHAGVVCCLTSRMPPDEFARLVPAGS